MEEDPDQYGKMMLTEPSKDHFKNDQGTAT